MSHYLDPTVKASTPYGDFVLPRATPLSQILAQHEVKVRIPYTPRPHLMPYHRRTKRMAIIVAHRRFGKTVGEVNEGIRRITKNTRKFPVPQGAFISPTYAQGKRNAWQYAKYYTKNMPGVKVSEAELTITLPNGGKYMFVGSDNYDALRGMYLDHASLDEYGLQDPLVWGSVVRPALADYEGSATFISSANGRNHLWDLLKKHEDDPKWFTAIFKASETGILSQEELDDAKATMSESQYQQEYECNFDAAVQGAYYGKEIALAEAEGRITFVPFDKAHPVYASWDLGIADHMALWTFQVINGEWHWLDYYANYSQDLPHYVEWSNSLPYNIKVHFVPHDGKQRNLTTAKTTLQFMEGLELNVEMVPKVPSVNDRIHACRMVLNRCYFDRKGTAKGVDCLRMYESEWSDENKVLSLKPKHNWASHGADAFGCGVMGYEERGRAGQSSKEERYQGAESWMN